MFELIRPRVELFGAWTAAHREWGPGLHEDGFGISPDDDVETAEGFGDWIERVRKSPGNSWWVLDGGAVLGGIALRDADDERVSRLGHVGYGIRPSARGRGAATWALGQVLLVAARFGVDPVIAVCRDDNPGSIATIEHHGAVLIAVEQHGAVHVRRYSIPVRR
ncbi:GNAT family N-acetyltransferase [Curtobacterium pusillum]|uniref:GNAT family N-acetyltransferase n=1 Tax=Curtobacterium pusillum TaxID=69373 RepID=UPI00381FB4F8